MREAGVEPARLSALEPKSSASANSATLAGRCLVQCIMASFCAWQHVGPRYPIHSTLSATILKEEIE